MNLKFIGTDGFKGLKHGKVYSAAILVDANGDTIYVRRYVDGEVWDYPYSSPAAFAANWAKPGQKVIVRKKTAIEDSDAYSKYKRAIKRMKTVTLLDLLLAGVGGGEKRD